MQIIQHRRALHQIPELDRDLPETLAYLRKVLTPLGCTLSSPIPGALCAFFDFGRADAIAFRSDADALPIQENTGLPFASRHPGKMHACGHDGHMTMLLLLAELIAAHREAMTKNVVLLFQPAEEGGGGAKRMIEAGALREPPVDRIYGLHVWPTVPKGKVGVRWGPMMAQTLEFDMIVHGRSAHGASPQLGVDAVVVAAELIGLLQTAITRNLDPHEDALLTIGKISGGTARNVIADKVVLNATLRVFSASVYEKLHGRIQDMLQGLTLATGARFEFQKLMQYPCVDNPRPMVEDFYRYMDMSDVVLVEPAMAAEDFACYQQEVPGLFLFLGIGGGKNCQPLHNCRFDFDEDALLMGVEIYWRLLGM